jgi:GH15 family glucan-1,4-alpha-glucosidase
MRSNRANYSYVWPRDGALVAAVLDRVRLHDVARQYHEFTIPLISDRQPFFLQKYNVDGTLGATWHPWVFDGRPSIPFQQDETALTLWSVWRHVQATGDYEWLSRYYKTFVKPMTSFLTIFPTMSYDLWEERRGLHTFTVATVVAGLIAAAEMAVKCGDESSQASLGVASQAKAQLLNLHVDPQTGAFLRGDESLPGLSTRWDRTTDASLLLVGRFAGLAPDHPVVMATNKRVEEELWVHSAIGGLARYSGDYYGRVIDAYPGNPWVITTMWLAQEKIRAARSLSDLDRPLELLQWAVERSGTTGVLGEQFHPDTGEVVTVSPLTWSHSEFIATCLDWVEKHRDLV